MTTITTSVSAPDWWLETERLMSLADPSFAHRPAQARAATVFDSALRSRTHAALDLPTGSGKSLLALAAAEHATGRTVISTATKALQSQIRDKDEPNLRAAGVLTKEVVILEGRGNFACLNRAVHEIDKLQPASKKIVRMVTKHLRANPGEARRDQIPVAIPDHLWVRICSDTDACDILDCRISSTCAYTKVRDHARIAEIVVVNHSLLLADAQIKGGSAVNWGLKTPDEGEKVSPGVLGPYKNLIIDEAHALESAAEGFGEQRVSIRGLQALMTRISKLRMSGAATAHMATCLDELKMSMLGLPTGALLQPTGTDATIFGPSIDAAQDASDALRLLIAGGYGGSGKNDGEMLSRACRNVRDKLKSIDQALRTGSDKFGPRAVSAEAAMGSTEATGIKSQLVDASGWLVDNLFSMVPTVAMSGTLAIPSRRDWVIERIGLDAKVEVLPTSFDLRSQRLVYVTPRVDHPGVASKARVDPVDVAELEQLIEASSGRALVLFPANVDLKNTARTIKISHKLLAQGVTPDGKSAKGETVYMSNAALAAEFTADVSSVLLATRSFFEGVDFPGEQCSLVVIMRFPNLRPDDPLVLARRRHVERRGGNPWIEYQEPSMQLIFRQAAGRAIRRVDDRGVVAVLDPRCGSKGYAKTALRSLAPSDYTDKLDDVRRFLA